MELSPTEQRRRADAIERLLSELESADDHDGYWNAWPRPELGGRTMSQALRAGDRDAVLRVIYAAYRRSEESAERHAADPEFMAMLERKRAEIALRQSHLSSRPRSA